MTWSEEDRLDIANAAALVTSQSRVSIRSLQLHPISLVLTLRLQLLEDGDDSDDDGDAGGSSMRYKKGLVMEVLSSIGTAASTLSSISETELNLNALILKVCFFFPSCLCRVVSECVCGVLVMFVVRARVFACVRVCFSLEHTVVMTHCTGLLSVQNVFCDQNELVGDIMGHYTTEGLKQAYKVCIVFL